MGKDKGRNMNKKIKTWISKAEQIYNHFAQRKNPKIWQELLNEISPDSPLFFKWRNQFLLYLNNHPFLSFKVYQFINQTFHIAEDYYALMSKENIKKTAHNQTGCDEYSLLSKENEEEKVRQYGSEKEKEEFTHIISTMQEENMYVSEPLLYDNVLFDIDRMEVAADSVDYSRADDYIYEYLEITGNFRKSNAQTNREKNGRFGRTTEYRQSIENYYTNLSNLSRYGYTSVYEKQQFMWLSCWFGDLDKSCAVAEDILQKEPQNLYAASYKVYLQTKKKWAAGTLTGMSITRIAENITVLDRETNLCRIMIKTALAFCEMQQRNFRKVISILEEILDYSQMPFLNNFTGCYTPDFWQSQQGIKISAYQAIVLCGGHKAYQDSYELLHRAYQLLLEENCITDVCNVISQKQIPIDCLNKFDSTAESVLCMAKAYLYTGAYEQAYHIIYDEKNKQMMIKNKCQTEYFIIMTDVLFARGDYGECIKTAENLDRILSKNKKVFCDRWEKTVYNRIFCHNLYLLAQCSLLEKNYENACFYSECLMEEDFTAVQVYVIYLKACFFLCKFDKVKQTYDKIRFLFGGWEAGYYAAQAVLRQKRFWRDIQYEEAAGILWKINKSQFPTGCMTNTGSRTLEIKTGLLQSLIKAGLLDSEQEQEQLYKQTLRIFENQKETSKYNIENHSLSYSQKETGWHDMETALILAQFAMDRNKNSEAYEILENYHKEQKEEPREPLFWYDFAICLEAAGEEKAALNIYEKILKEYGVYADICIRISKYYQQRYFLHTFSLEDKKTALEYLQRQEENEDIPPYLELAEYYYQLTEYDNAIEIYLKNQEKVPDLYCQRGYELMGNCFQRIYRFETAEKYFGASLVCGPKSAQIYFETAEVLKECKKYKQAVWWHQRAMQKFGEVYDRGYEAIGDLYLLLEESNKALAYYHMQWVFACDKTEVDRERGEWLKMRYYKRMMYFYLMEGQTEIAFEWAEQGIQELSVASCRAKLAMFYADALMYRGAEPALQVMEECMKRDEEKLKIEKNYKLLLEMKAQLLSYYFLTGKRQELAKGAEEFGDIFSIAYPQAKIEDYAEIKREGPKRYGEIGWYYLALGKEDFAQQCFQKQWAMKSCIGCRSRHGCYRGYVNIARYCEAAKKYNRAICFYKELLSQRHLPNHVQAKEALQRLQKMPKGERGEEFRRW
ncbi:MAG: tetratricopeptide repeat protein [Lachnospiraceae bacterium]|nr:tetratricopeptide repeat protein [Lachnospiraceae bacterium]